MQVLLVEDSAADAALIEALLQRAETPFVVHQVRTRAGFLDAVRQPVDIIVCDLHLPGFGGEEALAIRNEQAPEVPFVLVSGVVDDRTAAALLRNGVSDYLLKDRLERLAPAIERCLRESKRETALSRAQRHHQRASHVLDVLVNRSPDGLALVDGDGEIRFASDGLGWLTGIDPADLRGRNLLGLVDDGDLGDLADHLRDVVAYPNVADTCRATIRSTNGRRSRAEFVMNNRLDDPELAGVVVRIKDITEQVAAERRLSEEHAVLDAIARGSSPAGVLADVARLVSDSQPTWQVGFEFFADGFHLSTVVPGQPAVVAPIEVHGKPVGTLRADAPPGTPDLDPARLGAGVRLAALVAKNALADHALREEVLSDSMTGLRNRTFFLERLRERLARGSQTVLLLADIDRMRHVNDTFGHEAGDELIRSLARRWQELAPADGVVARLGGDAFGIMVDGADEFRVFRLAHELLEGTRDPIQLPGHETDVTISVGLAEGSSGSAGEVLAKAETGLEEAKARGGDRIHVVDDETRARLRDQMLLERELRAAIPRGELRSLCQPIIDLDSGALIGVEALVRWEHPTRGPLVPEQFLPGAAATDLIEQITEWMLDAAGPQAGRLRPLGELTLSINASARDLVNPDFPDLVLASLLRHELPTSALAVEVTETAALTDLAMTRRTVASLRESGVAVYLDDFGTGYSSLSHLGDLPVDALKVDRSFVGMFLHAPRTHAIVSAIVAMGQALGMQVIAEGVETHEQAEALRALGVDAVQGYLYSRPVDAADLVRWGLDRQAASR